jgi:hypothetical protein
MHSSKKVVPINLTEIHINQPPRQKKSTRFSRTLKKITPQRFRRVVRSNETLLPTVVRSNEVVNFENLLTTMGPNLLISNQLEVENRKALTRASRQLKNTPLNPSDKNILRGIRHEIVPLNNNDEENNVLRKRQFNTITNYEQFTIKDWNDFIGEPKYFRKILNVAVVGLSKLCEDGTITNSYRKPISASETIELFRKGKIIIPVRGKDNNNVSHFYEYRRNFNYNLSRGKIPIYRYAKNSLFNREKRLFGKRKIYGILMKTGITFKDEIEDESEFFNDQTVIQKLSQGEIKFDTKNVLVIGNQNLHNVSGFESLTHGTLHSKNVQKNIPPYLKLHRIGILLKNDLKNIIQKNMVFHAPWDSKVKKVNRAKSNSAIKKIEELKDAEQYFTALNAGWSIRNLKVNKIMTRVKKYIERLKGHPGIESANKKMYNNLYSQINLKKNTTSRK